MMNIPRYVPHLIIVLCFLPLIMWAKWSFIDVRSTDFNDYVLPWIMAIRVWGLGDAFGYHFSNYNPFYTYLLGVGDWLLGYPKPLYTAKALNFLGEALAGWYAYLLVALVWGRCSLLAVMAGLSVFISPSLLTNGSIAVQCDIWFGAMLLAAFYHLRRNQPEYAMVWAGLAVAFKLQAIFIAPFFLLMLLKGHVRWWHVALAALAYAATLLPAWLQGRDLYDLLTIYMGQFSKYAALNLGAANPYIFIPNHYYSTVVPWGIALTGVMYGVYLAYNYRYMPRMPSTVQAMLLALLCLMIAPYFLPKMHDRYFITADLFSLVLAFMVPRWAFLTIMLQISTLYSYPDFQFPYQDALPFNLEIREVHKVILTTLTFISVVYLCQKHVWRGKNETTASEA